MDIHLDELRKLLHESPEWRDDMADSRGIIYLRLGKRRKWHKSELAYVSENKDIVLDLDKDGYLIGIEFL